MLAVHAADFVSVNSGSVAGKGDEVSDGPSAWPLAQAIGDELTVAKDPGLPPWARVRVCMAVYPEEIRAALL